MGIDTGIFVRFHEALRCPVCLDVLEEPATSICGHTCCYKCWYTIAMYSDSSPPQITCPICRDRYEIGHFEEFSTFVALASGAVLIINLIAKHIIDDSPTKCIWPDCGARISYSNRKDHIAECIDDYRSTIPSYYRASYGAMVNGVDDETEIVVGLDNPLVTRIKWCRCGLGFDTKDRLDEHINNAHNTRLPEGYDELD